MPASQTKSLNASLSAAKAAKKDEFYTQYIDIQKEVEAYLEYDPDTFRAKHVYCNCDDPYESNFFKYFAANFNRLGLKRLTTTSYDGSPIAGQQALFPEFDQQDAPGRKKPHAAAFAVSIDQVTDLNGDGATDIQDVRLFLEQNEASRTPLKGHGDFRSDECVELLNQADIVVTNPPFSLFREFVAQLVEHDKKFLILGDQNAITLKEIFPLVQANKLWLGVDNGGTKWFAVPDDYDIKTESRKKFVGGVKFFSMGRVNWYTNLDHGRRHQKLDLMTQSDNLKFNKKLSGKSPYEKYANYDAIEVPYADAIPRDYPEKMGVPITFLDKYNPSQFEILGSSRTLGQPISEVAEKGTYVQGGPRFYLPNADGTYRRMYDRLVVRHRAQRPENGGKA